MSLHSQILIVIFLGIPLFGNAQSNLIAGKIVDENDKQPISRVQVVVKSIAEGKIVAFTQSSSEGLFEIKNEIDLSSCELEFSCIGYGRKKLKLAKDNLPLLIELSVSAVGLKEVIVTPPKMRHQGDTIIYNVDAFSSAQDRTIADVLKKMPGIEVQESGEIKYQGQSLNKFYIEGGDMLGGRYGLATNNISHKDVASVEVMEDHQPVKALEGLIISTQPAMNIKLKENAKSRWAGTLKAEGGIPSLWNAEAVAMRFKKTNQTLNTYKGNNAGKDYNDYNFFSSIGDFGGPQQNSQPSYINVSPVTPSTIDRNRYYFNQFNALTVNNLNKIKNDFDLISEIIASHDKQTFENSSQISIYLEGDTVLFEDKAESTDLHTKNIEGKLQLKGNKKGYYLNNDLKFNFGWNDTEMNTLGTYSNMQDAKVTNKQISNDFSTLWRTGNKIINFKTFNAYTEKPQRLTVAKKGTPPIYQKNDLSSFLSNSSTNYSFSLGRKFRANTELRYLYQNRSLTNTLDSARDQTDLQKHLINLAPGVSYNGDALHIGLSLPIFYQYLSYNNKSKTYYGVSPSLSMKWTISANLSLNSSLGVSKQLPQDDLLYEGYVLNNYRNKSLGYEDFSVGKSYSGGLGVEYKNVLNMLFGNANVMILKSQSKKRAEQFFIDDFIINSFTAHNTWRDAYIGSARVNKWLDLVNGTVSFAMSYHISQSDITRNNISVPYRSDFLDINGKIFSNLSKWCNLTYGASFANSRLYMNKEKKSDYNQFSESIEVAFSFITSFQMKTSVNHYYNEISEGEYKNFVLADISASYLVGDRWEFICTVNNIFNRKHYSYVVESNQSVTWQDYKIRPLNVLLGGTYRF